MASAVAAGEGLGLVGLNRNDEAGRLAAIDVIMRQHRQGGQRVPVVVPGVEASEGVTAAGTSAK